MSMEKRGDREVGEGGERDEEERCTEEGYSIMSCRNTLKWPSATTLLYDCYES